MALTAAFHGPEPDGPDQNISQSLHVDPGYGITLSRCEVETRELVPQAERAHEALGQLERRVAEAGVAARRAAGNTNSHTSEGNVSLTAMIVVWALTMSLSFYLTLMSAGALSFSEIGTVVAALAIVVGEIGGAIAIGNLIRANRVATALFRTLCAGLGLVVLGASVLRYNYFVGSPDIAAYGLDPMMAAVLLTVFVVFLLGVLVFYESRFDPMRVRLAWRERVCARAVAQALADRERARGNLVTRVAVIQEVVRRVATDALAAGTVGDTTHRQLVERLIADLGLDHLRPAPTA